MNTAIEKLLNSYRDLPRVDLIIPFADIRRALIDDLGQTIYIQVEPSDTAVP